MHKRRTANQDNKSINRPIAWPMRRFLCFVTSLTLSARNAPEIVLTVRVRSITVVIMGWEREQAHSLRISGGFFSACCFCFFCKNTIQFARKVRISFLLLTLQIGSSHGRGSFRAPDHSDRKKWTDHGKLLFRRAAFFASVFHFLHKGKCLLYLVHRHRKRRTQRPAAAAHDRPHGEGTGGADQGGVVGVQGVRISGSSFDWPFFSSFFSPFVAWPVNQCQFLCDFAQRIHDLLL